MMRRKRLGRTDIQLPIVGIGTGFTGVPTQNETAAEAGPPVNQELGIKYQR